MTTWQRRSLLALLVLYVVYASYFIWLSSTVFDGVRVFILSDDEMISMRYAANLAAGFGAVFNPGGEHVEGFSNPLWVGLMALVHFLPVVKTQTCLVVQLVCMAFLSLNIWMTFKLTQVLAPRNALAPLAAALATAVYLPLNNWGLLGGEVSLVALLVTTSMFFAVKALNADRPCPAPYVLMGICMLLRIDMTLPFVAMSAYLLVAGGKANRGANLRYAVLSLLVCGIAPEVFRWLYYGDFVPNTYYLKVEGVPLAERFARGAYVTWLHILRLNWVFFLLPFTLVFGGGGRAPLLLLWQVLVQLAYNVYVGGDAWEPIWASRFVCAVMPLFFVLVAHALFRPQFLRLSDIAANSVWQSVGKALVMLLAVVSFNIGDNPLRLGQWLLIDRPFEAEDNGVYFRTAQLLESITTPDAKLAVVWAGIVPYFCGDHYCLDMLGKNDRYVAHLPARPVGRYPWPLDYKPGHTKWDYAYSIGKESPDVVVQLWSKPEEALPYLREKYVPIGFAGYEFYFKRGSTDVLWDQISLRKAKLDKLMEGP